MAWAHPSNPPPPQQRQITHCVLLGRPPLCLYLLLYAQALALLPDSSLLLQLDQLGIALRGWDGQEC